MYFWSPEFCRSISASLTSAPAVIRNFSTPTGHPGEGGEIWQHFLCWYSEDEMDKKTDVLLSLIHIRYDSINDLEQYRKKTLSVSRENAVELQENEYYIADLLGLTVVTDEGKQLGTLKDVLQTGANDVYVVETPEGQEILIPAIRQCILSVDLEEQTMRVHLLKGLV